MSTETGHERGLYDYSTRNPRLPIHTDQTANDRLDIPGETRLAMYRRLQELRQLEKRAYDMFMQNLVKGTSHLSLGMEAIATGVSMAMRPDDYSFATYRGHAHTLARGVPMGAVLAELLGRTNGLLKGKGGSMHLTSVDHGMMGSYAIIGQRRGLVRPDAGEWPGRRVLLRRRDNEHRRISRGAELRCGVEAPNRLLLRKQPIYGVHTNRPGYRSRFSRRGKSSVLWVGAITG